MRKFMFFPIWKMETVEQWLQNMEKEGKRLTDVHFNYWFYFTESKRKNCKYIITYNMAKGPEADMYEYEHSLLSDYNANEIKVQSTTGCNCYRITCETDDMDPFWDSLYLYRNQYLKHVTLQYSKMAFFMAVPASFVAINILFIPCNPIIKLIAGLVGLLFLTYFAYYVVGYIKFRKK